MVLLLDSEESPKRCGATAFGKTVGLNGEESKHSLSLLNKSTTLSNRRSKNAQTHNRAAIPTTLAKPVHRPATSAPQDDHCARGHRLSLGVRCGGLQRIVKRVHSPTLPPALCLLAPVSTIASP